MPTFKKKNTVIEKIYFNQPTTQSPSDPTVKAAAPSAQSLAFPVLAHSL